jgi:hypothetical protein
MTPAMQMNLSPHDRMNPPGDHNTTPPRQLEQAQSLGSHMSMTEQERSAGPVPWQYSGANPVYSQGPPPPVDNTLPAHQAQAGCGFARWIHARCDNFSFTFLCVPSLGRVHRSLLPASSFLVFSFRGPRLAASFSRTSLPPCRAHQVGVTLGERTNHYLAQHFVMHSAGEKIISGPYASATDCHFGFIRNTVCATNLRVIVNTHTTWFFCLQADFHQSIFYECDPVS